MVIIYHYPAPAARCLSQLAFLTNFVRVAGAKSAQNRWPADRSAMNSSERGCLGRLLLGGLLCEVKERAEGLLVTDGEIRESLAVERNARLLETVHENGVRKALSPDRSVDSADPERAEVPLAHAPVAKGVGQRFQERFVGNPIVAPARRAKALDSFITLRRCFNPLTPRLIRAILYVPLRPNRESSAPDA